MLMKKTVLGVIILSLPVILLMVASSAMIRHERERCVRESAKLVFVSAYAGLGVALSENAEVGTSESLYLLRGRKESFPICVEIVDYGFHEWSLKIVTSDRRLLRLGLLEAVGAEGENMLVTYAYWENDGANDKKTD